jgi:hypothetical protein
VRPILPAAKAALVAVTQTTSSNAAMISIASRSIAGFIARFSRNSRGCNRL